jgi:hypothetical protein
MPNAQVWMRRFHSRSRDDLTDTRRMPTDVTGQFSLAETRHALARTPATLRLLVGQLPEDALTFHEAPGHWHPIDVLCHLADGEITDWIPRARIVMSDAADKRFTPFDMQSAFNRYRGWTAPALLDEFQRLRNDSLAALDALQISVADLQRQGVHPEFGAVTLEQLLGTWVTHDFAHITQIARVSTRFFGRHVGPWTKYFSLLR